MGITKIRGLFVLGLAAVLMAGCASTEPDDGPGMDPGTEAPTQATEPEARPEPTPEPVKPMVDRGKIVVPLDEMGGNISLFSELEKGTTFFIELPKEKVLPDEKYNDRPKDIDDLLNTV